MKKRGEKRPPKNGRKKTKKHEIKAKKMYKKHNCTSLQRRMKGVNNPIPKIRVGKKRTDKGLLFLKVIRDGEMPFPALY